MLSHTALARLKTCLTDMAQCNLHKGKEKPQPGCSTLYLISHFKTACLLHVFLLAGKVSVLVFAAPPLSKTHSCSCSKQPLVRNWEGQSLGAASISAFLKTKFLFQEINFWLILQLCQGKANHNHSPTKEIKIQYFKSHKQDTSVKISVFISSSLQMNKHIIHTLLFYLVQTKTWSKPTLYWWDLFHKANKTCWRKEQGGWPRREAVPAARQGSHTSSSSLKQGGYSTLSLGMLA